MKDNATEYSMICPRLPGKVLLRNKNGSTIWLKYGGCLKIRIKTLLPIPDLPTEIEMERGTLRDLFLKVFRLVHSPRELVNSESGEIKEDSILEARLNGTPYYNLPKGIDEELSDGDTVTLTVMMLGGG